MSNRGKKKPANFAESLLLDAKRPREEEDQASGSAFSSIDGMDTPTGVPREGGEGYGHGGLGDKTPATVLKFPRLALESKGDKKEEIVIKGPSPPPAPAAISAVAPLYSPP